MNPTRTIALLLAAASRHPGIKNWLRQLGLSYLQAQRSIPVGANFEIPEIMPIVARRADGTAAPRLNLLIPAVSQRHVFGGIATALQVFDALRQNFSTARILITDESAPEIGAKAFYADWPVVPMTGEPLIGNHIVALGDRWQQTLAIHEQDYFMATAWWTAHGARQLLRWQQQQLSVSMSRQLVYLIQDYEPGFYPWSSRFLMAKCTYEQPENTFAIINSSWLAQYLELQGHHFVSQYILEPRMHPHLTAIRARKSRFDKAQQLLVYGRPSTDRNAFFMIVATLRLWVQQYPWASQWRIVAAGEDFASVELGRGCRLSSLGKLSLEDYADELARTAVGLSFMVSPHPSYPPLEMAAFGIRVITNQFANKDLSGVSSYLISVAQVSPESLANSLRTLTTQFDALDESARHLTISDIDWSDQFLQVAPDASTWSAHVAEQLLTT